MHVKNGPNLRDLALQVVTALPAAGANNNTAAIDLGETAGIVHRGELELEVPAVPNLADAKSITYTVQHSADNITFVDLGPVFKQTGAGGVGAAALSKRIGLPSTALRYFRVNQAVEAAGGDNTAKSSTFAFIAGE